jgi:hypothetical protein
MRGARYRRLPSSAAGTGHSPPSLGGRGELMAESGFCAASRFACFSSARRFSSFLPKRCGLAGLNVGSRPCKYTLFSANSLWLVQMRPDSAREKSRALPAAQVDNRRRWISGRRITDCESYGLHGRSTRIGSAYDDSMNADRLQVGTPSRRAL